YCLAEKVDVAVAGAGVGAFGEEDSVGVLGGVDGFLDGVEGVVERAVFERVADGGVIGAGIVGGVVVDIDCRRKTDGGRNQVQHGDYGFARGGHVSLFF